jgi:prophage DNA circulation protein
MVDVRVRSSIQLTSPNGNEFTCNWTGNKQTFEKKLGIYNYPKVKGTVIDDLGITGDVFPLNLIFDGPGYDQEAQRFLDACRETGKWEVIHPTKGFKGLQLMSVGDDDQPVASKGRKVIETRWMEYIDPATLKTAAQLAAEAGAKLNEFNIAAADRFADKVGIDSFGERLGITSTAAAISTAVDKVLGPLAAANETVAKRMEDTQRGLQSTLEAAILNPLKLAGQIQQTILLPGEAIADTRARLRAYAALAAEIFGLSDDEDDDQAANASYTRELSLSAVIGALSNIATTSIGSSGSGSLQTQEQAVETIDDIAALFSAITDNLDADQEKFADKTLDERYFSQTETYRLAVVLIAASQEYLLTGLFDLKVEKRFVLLTDSDPIALTIQEYGSMGENEENYQLFLESNNLKNNEIFIINQGTTVVVYV